MAPNQNNETIIQYKEAGLVLSPSGTNFSTACGIVSIIFMAIGFMISNLVFVCFGGFLLVYSGLVMEQIELCMEIEENVENGTTNGPSVP